MSAPGVWKSRAGKDFGSAPFLIAGIVNVTPDSFSDGGLHLAPEDALDHCRRLVAEGAAILDIGGESTRPGSAPVTPEVERERALPVVAGCAALRDGAPGGMPGGGIHVAVDTWRASTAAAVLEAGADVINDISGSTFDPRMPEVLGAYRPGYVLMHTPAPPATMREHTAYPGFPSVVDAVLDFFERRMTVLTAAGLPEENIILDPGIGFGKTAGQNMELLRNTDRLHSLGRPLYVGVSRKSLFGDLLGLPLAARDAATHAATALLAERGVYAHRVHDVAGAAAALRLATLMR
ncbi:MAG: dihydropteroate synthase [Deltaproteobacteria bacterium]|jgi:dihydropteroate synthase|nr:dihydropteroate synthase [Deltaproteobacteria bacterium]